MNLKLLLVYLLGFFVYTRGYWERFTPVPVGIIIEIICLCIILFFFRPKGTKTDIIFAILASFGVLSSIATNSTVNYIKYFRYLFYSYALISVVFYSKFSIRQSRSLFRYLLFLISLQGLAAIIQIFILHDRVEGYVGMMSSSGGATATTFSVFIIGLAMTVYSFLKYKWRKRYIAIGIIVFLSILVGYSSGKRAIFYLIPGIMIFSVVISFIIAKRHKIKLPVIKIGYLIAILVLAIPLYVYGIKTSKGFNDTLSGSESNSEVISTMLDYSVNYENAISVNSGATIGRSNTSRRLLASLSQNISFIFFGRGFGTVKDEVAIAEAGVGYGFVGFTSDLFSGGLIYAILAAVFFLFLIFSSRRTDFDAFSLSIKIIIGVIFCIIHFFYSTDFTMSLRLNYIFAFILAYINSPYYARQRRYSLNFLKNDFVS